MSLELISKVLYDYWYIPASIWAIIGMTHHSRTYDYMRSVSITDDDSRFTDYVIAFWYCIFLGAFSSILYPNSHKDN